MLMLTSLLVTRSSSELPSLLARKRKPGAGRHSAVVSTLAAALSRWNPLTLRRLSTSSDNTYSSPPFSEITSCSGDRKWATAQSRLILTPSCFLSRMLVVTSLSPVQLRDTPYRGMPWFR